MSTGRATDRKMESSRKVSATALAARPIYPSELNQNDVLLGRGSHLVKYEGNVRFRRLVQDRKAEYTACLRHHMKDNIAREIISTVESRQGRFLRKVESLVEGAQLGIPQGVQPWVHVDVSVVLEKVKQAFRDSNKETSSEQPTEIAAPTESSATRSLQGEGVASRPTEHVQPSALALGRRRSGEATLADSIEQQRIALVQQQRDEQVRQQQRLEQQFIAQIDSQLGGTQGAMQPLSASWLSADRHPNTMHRGPVEASNGVIGNAILQQLQAQTLAELQASIIRSEQIRNVLAASQHRQHMVNSLGLQELNPSWTTSLPTAGAYSQLFRGPSQGYFHPNSASMEQQILAAYRNPAILSALNPPAIPSSFLHHLSGTGAGPNVFSHQTQVALAEAVRRLTLPPAQSPADFEESAAGAAAPLPERKRSPSDASSPSYASGGLAKKRAKRNSK
jgi:hypothetical protein